MRDLKTRYWTSTGYKTSGTRVDLSVDNQTNGIPVKPLCLFHMVKWQMAFVDSIIPYFVYGALSKTGHIFGQSCDWDVHHLKLHCVLKKTSEWVNGLAVIWIRHHKPSCPDKSTSLWPRCPPSANPATERNYAFRPLRGRHNGHDGASNHQPRHCLLNRLFGRRSKQTSKLHVTSLSVANSTRVYWKFRDASGVQGEIVRQKFYAMINIGIPYLWSFMIDTS